MERVSFVLLVDKCWGNQEWNGQDRDSLSAGFELPNRRTVMLTASKNKEWQGREIFPLTREYLMNPCSRNS